VIEYVQIAAKYAKGLVNLERTCFPGTDPDDLLSEEGVKSQCETFPEGGFVALDDGVVIGYGMGAFVDYDITNPQHAMDDVLGHLGTDHHDPHGTWYYGSGIAVLPAYRGRGIGRALYNRRKGVVQAHNRAGIIAGGEIPGYADVKDLMTAAEYVSEVSAGNRFDPTLSFQLDNGFEVRGVVADYMQNPAVGNWASFIVWHNPDFDSALLEAEKGTA